MAGPDLSGPAAGVVSKHQAGRLAAVTAGEEDHILLPRRGAMARPFDRGVLGRQRGGPAKTKGSQTTGTGFFSKISHFRLLEQNFSGF